MVNTAVQDVYRRVGQKKAGKGHTHIFPFSQENPVGPERTKTDVYKCAVEATKSKKIVCGIKGPSIRLD